MKRLLGIGLGLLVALSLVGCGKDDETFPCEAHGAIQRIVTVFAGAPPSGEYECQDGHSELWENGVKTVG